MTKQPLQKRRRVVAAVTAVGTVLAGSLARPRAAASVASSHREAPLIAGDPAVDNTDLYAFVSPDRPGLRHVHRELDPVRGAQRRPELLPVRHRRRVQHQRRQRRRRQGRRHVPVDVQERRPARRRHVPLQQRPGHLARRREPAVPADLHARVVVQRRRRSRPGSPTRPVAPSRVGAASMPDYADAARRRPSIQLPGGWKIFAGQADDPFFLDLRVFDLLYGGDLSEVGQDTLAGYNVNTHRAAGAVQGRRAEAATPSATRSSASGPPPTAAGCGVTGQTDAGHRRPRPGLPPGQPAGQRGRRPGRTSRTPSTRSRPDKDASIPAVVKRVTDPEVPQADRGASTASRRPPTPRNDLVEIFLTGITTKAGGPIKADLNSQLNNTDVDAEAVPPVGDAAAQPERAGRRPARTGSACSPGTCRASRTAGGSPTTSSTSSCRRVEGAAQTGKLVDALAAGDKVDANDNAFGDDVPVRRPAERGAVNTRRRHGRRCGRSGAQRSTTAGTVADPGRRRRGVRRPA